MATITDAAEFDAPASEVWALLMDWAAIIDWMPGGYIRSLECAGHGPGAALETRTPTVSQVRLIRESIDPDGMRKREFR